MENFVVRSDEMGIGRKITEEFIEQTCALIHGEFKSLIKEMTTAINSAQNKDDDW